jgi:hypothetical protein
MGQHVYARGHRRPIADLHLRSEINEAFRTHVRGIADLKVREARNFEVDQMTAMNYSAFANARSKAAKPPTSPRRGPREGYPPAT